MLKSAAEVTRWLKTQEEIVILVSAYLAPIKAYIARCESDPAYANDLNALYQLHTLVQNWDSVILHHQLTEMNLYPYYLPLQRQQHSFVTDVTSQTIPSRSRPTGDFWKILRRGIGAMSEIIVAFAKVPPPPFSVTLAAGTPFDGYLLVSRLTESATKCLYIADAYLDASLFDRYLYRVKAGVKVSLRTNPDRWSRKGWKEQFEQAESLFCAQHADYERLDRTDLHARYLVTETGGWRIDGSIKDIATTKDCPIHTITPEERDRVVTELFT